MQDERFSLGQLKSIIASFRHSLIFHDNLTPSMREIMQEDLQFYEQQRDLIERRLGIGEKVN